MAMEPLVRRRWPNRIVSWTRLLAGRWRDPLVARDLLIGLTAGIAGGLTVTMLGHLLCRALDVADPIPYTEMLGMLTGMRRVLGGMFNILFGAIYIPIFMTLATLLIQIVVRKLWLAAPIIWLMIATMVVTDTRGWNSAQAIALSIMVGITLLVTIRFGMVAGPAPVFSMFLMFSVPFRPDFSSWTGLPGATILAVLLTLAVTAFYFSLAGRSMMRGDLLAD